MARQGSGEQNLTYSRIPILKERLARYRFLNSSVSLTPLEQQASAELETDDDQLQAETINNYHGELFTKKSRSVTSDAMPYLEPVTNILPHPKFRSCLSKMTVHSRDQKIYAKQKVSNSMEQEGILSDAFVTNSVLFSEPDLELKPDPKLDTKLELGMESDVERQNNRAGSSRSSMTLRRQYPCKNYARIQFDNYRNLPDIEGTSMELDNKDCISPNEKKLLKRKMSPIKFDGKKGLYLRFTPLPNIGQQ